MTKYFPLNVATGKAFCNRLGEQEHLLANISQNKPTLIMSTRRYGKTSLVSQVVKKNHCYYTKIDFMSAIDVEDVERIITEGVGNLLVNLEKGPKKAITIATQFFSDLNFNISFSKGGLKFETNVRSIKPHRRIRSLLLRLRELSQKYEKQLVLFFDEFQHLYEIVEDDSIEAVIREVAQEPDNLSFVFSGSNRHLLQKIFDDKNRPFYKMCDKIGLNRITEDHYHHHIMNIAKLTKKEGVDKSIVDIVLDCTARHPYYVNLLCDRIWRIETLNERSVAQAWSEYANEERSQVVNEIDNLSQSQRKLLIVLARTGGTSLPRSDDFIIKCGMAGSTISQALKTLVRKDYVDVNDGFYTVLDPLIRYVLSI